MNIDIREEKDTTSLLIMHKGEWVLDGGLVLPDRETAQRVRAMLYAVYCIGEDK